MRWTARSLRDLDAIHDWIARDGAVAADSFIATLRPRVELAGRFPNAGRVVPELGRDDVREAIEGAYRIVYLISGDAIDVLTVFEGHRRLPPRIGA